MEITQITEVRRKNLAAWIEEKFGGNRSAFCRATGKHQNLINLVLSTNPNTRRNIGERLARDIEVRSGMPAGWLDIETQGGPSGTVYTFPIVRLDNLAESGLEKIVLGQDVAQRQLDRPSSMTAVRACYEPTGDMAPAISQGDLMFVDTDVADFDRNGVYLIARDKSVFVRRVTRLITGNFRISSDRDPSGDVEGQPGKQKLKPVGRVVGLMRFGQP